MPYSHWSGFELPEPHLSFYFNFVGVDQITPETVGTMGYQASLTNLILAAGEKGSSYCV